MIFNKLYFIKFHFLDFSSSFFYVLFENQKSFRVIEELENPQADNYCHSIIAKATGLIGENYLDSITEELNHDFDVLYHLHFQS